MSTLAMLGTNWNILHHVNHNWEICAMVDPTDLDVWNV